MIKWITERLGTASYYDDVLVALASDTQLLDVRELIDNEGNDPARLRAIINRGAEQLRLGQRLLICCDKGISRSNALALGTLLAAGMPYTQALQQLADAGATDINLGMLKEIRALYEPVRPSTSKLPSRILVTGATGFIGRAVLDGLGPSYQLLGPDRSKYDLRHDLLALDDFVSDQRIDTIVHLAHPRSRNSIGAMGEALAMMKTVLELCRLNSLRLVYLSSLAVFSGYTGADIVQAGSALTPRPRGVYAETKYLCEQLIRCYQESSAGNLVLVRAGFVYGPNMDKGMFVPKFFEWAMQNRVIQTHRYRNGLPSFDFLYIDDLVDAIRLALEKGRLLLPVHIGSGRATTTHHLAQEIVRVTGSSSPVETLDIQGETTRVVVDPDEAARELQFVPKVSLETGLEMIWDALRPEDKAKLAPDLKA